MGTAISKNARARSGSKTDSGSDVSFVLCFLFYLLFNLLQIIQASMPFVPQDFGYGSGRNTGHNPHIWCVEEDRASPCAEVPSAGHKYCLAWPDLPVYRGMHGSLLRFRRVRSSSGGSGGGGDSSGGGGGGSGSGLLTPPV